MQIHAQTKSTLVALVSTAALIGCGEKQADTEFVKLPPPLKAMQETHESFHGSLCHEFTCFENKAGYEWARENKVTKPKICKDQHEQSAFFQNGCIAFTIDPSDPPYDLNEGDGEYGC